MTQITTGRRLFYFFPVLFTFCLPFGSLVLSGIITAWFITSFFQFNRKHVLKGLRNPGAWLMWIFFAFTVISAMVSENGKEALSAIEIKLAFLVFPWLFFCHEWHPAIIKRCIASFVSGCFFASLYLIIRATFYASEGQTEYFFYTLFSDFIHASYFAMYLCLAIVFVVIFYPTWFRTQRPYIYSSWLFISVFVVTIFLCASKMGLITLFIITPALVYYRLRRRVNAKVLVLSLASVLLAGLLGVRVFPAAQERLRSISEFSFEKLDRTAVESTAVRVLIWREAAGIISSNLITGTGVGDANDELYKSYESNGLTGAYAYRLNAHNQFLQTFIGMGIPGIILITLLTAFQAIWGFRERNFLLFIFSLIVTVNFLVESMLQTSAGVIFFAFFYCMFRLVGHNDLLVENAKDEDLVK